MSANKNAKEENYSDNSRYPHIDLLKSPARLLAHLENRSEDESLTKQLLEAAQWILCSPEAISFARLTALCYDVPTKLQDGPQCGIVALWMASRALIKSNTRCNGNEEITNNCSASENTKQFQDLESEMFPSVEWIQNMAKEKRFTRKGEMFSSDNLSALAGMCFQYFTTQCNSNKSTLSSYVIKKNVFAMLTSYESMLDFFTNTHYHQVLLVPYDSDHDQRPCTKRGHKSHWCAIVGIATFLPNSKISNAKSIERLNSFSLNESRNTKSDTSKSTSEYLTLVDDSSRIVVIAKSKMLAKSYEKVNEALRKQVLSQDRKENNNQDEDENLCFYLIARQSKSKRLFLFDPQQLAVSNRNLIEVYTDRNLVQNSTSYEENFDRYVIPSGGLQEGLASQAIVLKMEI